jgi:hypothetical protein
MAPEGTAIVTAVDNLVTKTAAGDDILTGLLPNYLARLEARVFRLRGLAGALGQGALPAQDQAELHRTAHSMASSAAIFGHWELSAAARAAEEIFESPAGGFTVQRASLLHLVEEAERVLGSSNAGARAITEVSSPSVASG